MKNFNTFQELYNYCSYCHNCKNNTQEISFNQWGSKNSLIKFIKEEKFFKIYSNHKNFEKEMYNVNYIIDCQNNKFGIDIEKSTEYIKDTNEVNIIASAEQSLIQDEENKKINRIANIDYNFSLRGLCSICKLSGITTNPILISLKHKTIPDLSISTEYINMEYSSELFNITISHFSNRSYISRFKKEDNMPTLISNGGLFETTVCNFDFSNKERLVDRIKTLMTFT